MCSAIASAEQEGRMRTTFGVGLAVILAAAALGMWLRSSSNDVTSTVPEAAAKASGTPVLPIEIMRNTGKDLPDKTPPEPC